MQSEPFYRFGPFLINRQTRQVFRHHDLLAISPKAFDLLLALIESNGEVVEKSALLQRVWPDVRVEEINLLVHISALRKAFGDNPNQPSYIQTVSKRGYRFVANLKEERSESGASVTALDGAAVPALEQPTEQEAAAARNSSSRLRHGSTGRKVLAATLAASSLMLIGCLWLFIRPQPAPVAPVETSIAVLPFKLLGSPEEEYLGMGISDALITKLSKTKSLIVRPTGSIMKYVGVAQDPLAIGAELQVYSVLDGTIQKAGDRIRVTVQMLRVADGLPLWAETFDEDYTDIFALEDSISRRVTKSLAVRLSDEDNRQLASQDTQNSEAHYAYLKGRFFWNQRNADGYQKAIAAFQQAIELDPNYALGYSGLADCYSVLARLDQDREASLEKARAMTAKALALNPDLAEAQASAGLLFLYDRDWQRAERAFQRALDLQPNYATAHQWYSRYLTIRGRFPEALEELDKALRLDPFSIVMNLNLAQTYYYSRQYDKAIRQFEKTRELGPTPAYLLLIEAGIGLARARQNDCETALPNWQAISRLSEDDPTGLALLAQGYATCGETNKARRVLRQALQVGDQQSISPVDLTAVYTSLGEKGAALTCLQQAYEDHRAELNWVSVDPAFDSLRSDAQFLALLRQLGMEEPN